MSLAADILDRSSGVALVKAELENTSRRIDRLGEIVMNHETRIARLEGSIGAGSVVDVKLARKRLPRK